MVTAAGAAANGVPEASGSQTTRPHLNLRWRDWCGSWALPAARFSASAVGAKSLNTVKLQVRVRFGRYCLVGTEDVPLHPACSVMGFAC